MEGETLWTPLVWLLQAFSHIGTSWTGSGRAGGFGSEALLGFQEQTPLVARILSEVKTGWSLQTIFDFWGPLLQIPTIITLVFGASMIYCTIRVYQIWKIEKVQLQIATPVVDDQHVSKTSLRWQRILESASSDDSQKWRAAILEADQILNELLDTLGYKGETIGDKLRAVDVSAFKTVDFAWEAHQVRNHVAQDMQFELDARETRRIIKMYERVFEEFHFIGEHEEHHHESNH